MEGRNSSRHGICCDSALFQLEVWSCAFTMVGRRPDQVLAVRLMVDVAGSPSGSYFCSLQCKRFGGLIETSQGWYFSR